MGLHNKSWDNEQDQTLVNAVLESLEVGESISESFRQIARKLGRTVAAVSFRWNKTLSKQNVEVVQKAKEAATKRRNFVIVDKSVKMLTLETVVEDVKALFSQTTTKAVNDEEIQRLQNKIIELEAKNKELEIKNIEFQNKLKQVKQVFDNMKIGF